MIKKMFSIFCSVVFCALALPSLAHAYIDPGTGSIILQTIGVVFVAAGGFFFAMRNKISAFFS